MTKSFKVYFVVGHRFEDGAALGTVSGVSLYRQWNLKDRPFPSGSVKCRGHSWPTQSIFWSEIIVCSELPTTDTQTYPTGTDGQPWVFIHVCISNVLTYMI